MGERLSLLLPQGDLLSGIPLQILGVNVLGCALLGVIGARIPPGPSPLRAFLVVGLTGGFTTFSAFSQETARLMDSLGFHGAAAYAVGSLVLCLSAFHLGSRLGSWPRPSRRPSERGPT